MLGLCNGPSVCLSHQLIAAAMWFAAVLGHTWQVSVSICRRPSCSCMQRRIENRGMACWCCVFDWQKTNYIAVSSIADSSCWSFLLCPKLKLFYWGFEFSLPFILALICGQCADLVCMSHLYVMFQTDACCPEWLVVLSVLRWQIFAKHTTSSHSS